MTRLKEYRVPSCKNIFRLLRDRSITNRKESVRFECKKWTETLLMCTTKRNARIESVWNTTDTCAARRCTSAIAISSNGLEVAVASGDHCVVVYDVSHSNLVRRYVFRGHSRTPWSLAYHPDASKCLLVSACIGGHVCVWHTIRGVCVAHVYLPQCVINTALFHPCGDVELVLVADDVKVRAWHYRDASSCSLVTLMDCRHSIRAIEFVWSPIHGEQLVVATKLAISCICVSARGCCTPLDEKKSKTAKETQIVKWLTLGERGGMCSFRWRIKGADAAFQCVWNVGENVSVGHYCISPDGQWLAYIAYDANLCIASLYAGFPQVVKSVRIENASQITSLCFSASNEHVVITHDVVRQWWRPLFGDTSHDYEHGDDNNNSFLGNMVTHHYGSSLRVQGGVSLIESDCCGTLRTIVRRRDGQIVSTLKARTDDDGFNVVAVFPDSSIGIVYGTRKGGLLFESC